MMDFANGSFQYSEGQQKLIISPDQVTGEKIKLDEANVKILLDVYSSKIKKLVIFDVQLPLQSWALLKGTTFRFLQFLSIQRNRLTDSHVSTLVEIAMPKLTVLNLKFTAITSKCLKSIALGKWPQLNSIALGINNLNGNYEQHIDSFMRGKWPALQKLNLSGCGINSKLMDEIIKLSQISLWDLKQLLIDSNQLGNGFKNMRQCKWVNLQKLFLESSQINSFNFNEIFSILTRIQNISLQNNPLSPLSFKQIHHPCYEKLAELNLGQTNLSTANLKNLSKSNMPMLLKLQIWDNNISSEGIKHISKMRFTQLQDINLWANCLRNQGIVWIACIQMQKLKTMCLWQNRITNIGMAHLGIIQARYLLPKLQIKLSDNLITDQCYRHFTNIFSRLDLSQ